MLLFFATVISESDQKKADYLYLKYRQIVYTCAFKVIKDVYLAEEIVQNTFLAVMNKLDAIGNCDSKETANYLITAAKRFAYQEYKKQKWDTENKVDIDDIESTMPADTSVWDDVKSRAELRRISEAMKQLSPDQRLLIVGKYYYGFTYKDLADMINTTEKAVSTRIILIKRKLAKILSEEEVEEDEG